jgi:hypothetical protein
VTFVNEGSTVRRMSEQVSALEGLSFWRRAVRAVRRYFAARFRDVTRSEAAGYAVWGAMGVVVGVPEIWAAISGDDFYWPTISTTIGHLQERWPVVALLPVAIIVMGGYSVLRVGAGAPTVQADLQGLARTPQGRLTKEQVSVDELAAGEAPAMEERQEFGVVPYFAFATVVVVGGALAAVPSQNRFLVGYVLYSLIAVFWLIVPNVLAYWFKRDVPFTTLFFTLRCLGRRLQLVAALVAALLVILLLHLAFYPWPSPD